MAILLKASRVIEGNPEILLSSGTVIIGSLTSNNMVVAGDGIEPIHAMIEGDEQGGYKLLDMMSDHGVFLNKRRIQVVESLNIGDEITIGPISIQVLKAEEIAASQDEEDVQDLRKTRLSGEKEERGKQEKTTPVFKQQIFKPGRERPGGSVLEIVAIWMTSILDVKHYGDKPLPSGLPMKAEAILGDEHKGQLIGVGPDSQVRNLRFARIRDGKTKIYLNSEMKAKVRRGDAVQAVKGPVEIDISQKDLAIVRHGPLDYFLMHVSLPGPVLQKLKDAEGLFMAFVVTFLIYGLLILMLFLAPAKDYEVMPDKDAWSAIAALRTPTPVPTPDKPAVKEKQEIPKATPPPKIEPPKVPTPPPAAAKATPPPKETPPPQVASLKPAKKEVTENKGGAANVENKKNKDPYLGRKNDKLSAGNGGGAKGGTPGKAAGQIAGEEKKDQLGAEGGTKDIMSGVNLDQLGAGLGKTLNKTGPGAVATGLTSSGGGQGITKGTGNRGAHGLGGMGDNNSLSTGGPGTSIKDGFGAGGIGAGGAGGDGGNGSGGSGKKIVGSAVKVEVPMRDPSVDGGLTREEISAVIRANLAQIKACYDRHLQGNRQASGTMTMKWVIDGKSGRVNGGSVGFTQVDIKDAGFKDCLVGKVKAWKFPLPKEAQNVNVTFPFDFMAK